MKKPAFGNQLSANKQICIDSLTIRMMCSESTRNELLFIVAIDPLVRKCPVQVNSVSSTISCPLTVHLVILWNADGLEILRADYPASLTGCNVLGVDGEPHRLQAMSESEWQ